MTAFTTAFLAANLHQSAGFQKQLNSQTEQFNNHKALEQKRLDNQLQQLQKQSQDQQKQIEDLQKQVSIKRQKQAETARLASIQAAQALPAPQTASLSNAGNCEAYRPLVAQYGWNINVAMAVMHAESGCNPTAASRTCDHGLMQVNCVHSNLVSGNLASLDDPATNIRVAWLIYEGSGWTAWTTYTSGAYLRYL